MIIENKSFGFGYQTILPCCICGSIPAEVEPRFGYIVCEEHSKLSPVNIIVIKLRGETGVALMDCKRALSMNDNKYEDAKLWLLQKKHLKGRLVNIK
jgi:hypothetical protein